ncbi:ABC transporter ATP-binding protein [Gellertiella hungarica]|uniref:Peptide/nickel transport system ATP-binding protein/oligopeptide transport system ATP-binding protein n=1 Tax=Gellertiella hungarica TaxID=1572859 RepID=A0A7W6NIW7_9HYPH|nr:oligopeptide/dipeptide ABC transporter ATP-binding protein [Gellertiella hungarica]MBB4062844.1 peptide/nickel transport system ATP-binding protein/oligopeptide transport system ATP-binding protein [Gellertiella hungarica]
MTPPVLEVKDLVKAFPVGGFLDRLQVGKGSLLAPQRQLRAVNGVSLTIAPGEVFALVGESGCGKSTVAKTIARIYEPTSGEIRIDGEDVSRLPFRAMLPVRRKLQMIFQDPYASLDPRQRVRDIVMEPRLAQGGRLSRRELQDEAVALLAKVGLNAEQANRYPHQFSGGQRQRIGIARALSVRPTLIIADEPVSALDVSIQAQILNLMKDLRDEFRLSYLFVSHDLSVAHHIADRIGVMYLGFMVETASRDQLFREPKHPYTRVLLSAAPTLDKSNPGTKIEIRGEVPSALRLPSGCCFRTRCPLAFDRCAVERPALKPQADGSAVACHLHDRTDTERMIP